VAGSLGGPRETTPHGAGRSLVSCFECISDLGCFNFWWLSRAAVRTITGQVLGHTVWAALSSGLAQWELVLGIHWFLLLFLARVTVKSHPEEAEHTAPPCWCRACQLDLLRSTE
jgi:hypothetical protein